MAECIDMQHTCNSDADDNAEIWNRRSAEKSGTEGQQRVGDDGLKPRKAKVRGPSPNPSLAMRMRYATVLKTIMTFG